MAEEALRERDWFADVYKAVVTLGEWLIKPLFNLHPPAVGEHVRDITYVADPVTAKQKLDLVRPEGEGPFPVLVYVHGGGFISMDKSHYTRICKTFASAGYLVLNVNYRRAPRFRFPIALTDVGSAVAWALANAAAYGGDPSVMFLAGDSAGAHLVSTYATSLGDEALARVFRVQEMARPSRLAGLVLFYGAFDCETVIKTGFPFVRTMLRSFLSRDPELFKKRARDASPIRHIKGGYPSCFICYAVKDKLSSESAAFARELELEGVQREVMSVPPSECRIIPHGFINLFWRKCARSAMAAAVAFMDAKGKARP